MRNSKFLLIAVGLLLLLNITNIKPPPAALPSMQIGETLKGRVNRVVDGDSVYVDGKKLRLWGIDAPEEDEFGYDEAKKVLREIAYGKTVTCTCADIDRHGRSVVKCTLEDGQDVGDVMVRTGWALDYRKHTKGAYEKAEDEARDAKRGLWAPR